MKTSILLAKTMIVAAAKACNEMFYVDGEDRLTHEDMDELYKSVANELSLSEAASLRQIGMCVFPINSQLKFHTLSEAEQGKAMDSLMHKSAGNRTEPDVDHVAGFVNTLNDLTDKKQKSKRKKK